MIFQFSQHSTYNSEEIWVNYFSVFCVFPLLIQTDVLLNYLSCLGRGKCLLENDEGHRSQKLLDRQCHMHGRNAVVKQPAVFPPSSGHFFPTLLDVAIKKSGRIADSLFELICIKLWQLEKTMSIVYTFQLFFCHIIFCLWGWPWPSLWKWLFCFLKSSPFWNKISHTSAVPFTTFLRNCRPFLKSNNCHHSAT